MPKAASASTTSRGSTALSRRTATRKRQAVPTGKTGKLIDPAVRRALRQDDSGPLTVMVKLDTKGPGFGKLPVTNRPGSARERAFAREVDEEVHATESSSRQHYKLLSTAANVGVATVEASADIVRNLVRSAKVTGMKLKTG